MGASVSHTLTTEAQTARVRERWGDRAADAVGQAAAIFQSLDVVADGVLSRAEFGKSLGMLGTSNPQLSSFLFDAIDRDGNGDISLDEFVEFMMIQFFGTIKDKLEFGFRVIDLDKNGIITKVELVTMITTFFRLLTSFQLRAPEVTAYIDALWELWDLNKDEQISAEEYYNGCISNPQFIKYLGMTYNGPVDGVRQIGKKVFMGQAKWDFMLSVMIGIQIATENLGLPLQREFLADDFTKTVTLQLPSDNHHVEIESTAPDVFREIRKACGVSDQSFTSSLGVQQILGSLLMGDLTGLSELVSEGKSGSFFYFSADNRYLVKTISQSERRTLVAILPNLLKHMQEQPNTLITRIYGLYRIHLDDTVRRFVVMANVFNAALSISERYDIKGSTLGRTVGDENLNNTSLVFKDLDFIKKGRKINVRSELREPLLRQICADSKFLEANGIIDYSLLLGVHKNKNPPSTSIPINVVGGAPSLPAVATPPIVPAVVATAPARTFGRFDGRMSISRVFTRRRKPSSDARAVYSNMSDTELPSGRSLFQQDDGGMLSERTDADGSIVRGEEILFVGLIDTLISYEAFKLGEHLVKSIIYDGSQISVVPPEKYGPRFRAFVAQQGFDAEPPAEDK